MKIKIYFFLFLYCFKISISYIYLQYNLLKELDNILIKTLNKINDNSVIKLAVGQHHKYDICINFFTCFMSQ